MPRSPPSGLAETTLAQGTNLTDDTELLISQIQADKRAIVLSTLDLTDAQVQTFTPIYDEYQGEMKQQFVRGNDLINKFAANFGSMTDDAAKDLLKDFFKLRDSRNRYLRGHDRPRAPAGMRGGERVLRVARRTLFQGGQESKCEAAPGAANSY